MARRQMATQCWKCGTEGWRHEYAWVSNVDLCWPCAEAWERLGYLQRSAGTTFALTAAGAGAIPALESVAECALDGSPIYRRWIDEGVATAGAEARCPYCLGVSPLS